MLKATPLILEVLVKKIKTLKDIAVWLLIKVAACEALETVHIKGLHMLRYAFNMRHGRH